MLVGLSPNLSKRLREGNVKWAAKKTGERYGELTDTAGKFAGKATEVERGVKVARTAAMAAAIVVEASHLIASADMARMQRETIEKLDRLEAYHIIEHEAELERLYFRAREILEYPLDHDRQQELRQIRSQLLKLRIVWRKEAIHNLSQLKDPRNVGWLNTIFSGQEARDQHVIKAVLDEVGRFTLIDYTLRLDYTLGLASETWTESKYTIEAELVELTKLSTLLGEKCNYVSDARRDRVKHINGAMAYIPPYYEEMLQISNQNLDAILPAIDQSLVQVR